MPSQPSSAICAQFSASQPFSVAAILRRFSKVYLSRTKRSAASCSCFCSSDRDRSISSSSTHTSSLVIGGGARVLRGRRGQKPRTVAPDPSAPDYRGTSPYEWGGNYL